MSEVIHILAFESSCDDTSVCVLRASGAEKIPEVLSLSVQSQWEVHRRYGGVVPDLASRAHLSNLLPCVEKALSEAHIALDAIDVFAATGFPGLVGCLLIGHTAAKTLSFIYDKPFISCNHIEGHLMSAFLETRPEFPFLALVVSGGHTSLYHLKNFDEMIPIGVTRDDAAGEAFDKGAKLLGLEIPGGPEIDRLAQIGNSSRYPFGKIRVDGFDFSFSGVKSEFARLVAREGDALDKDDAAASYQSAIIDHLLEKTFYALHELKLNRLVVVGGVAANSQLRSRLASAQSRGEIQEWIAPSLRYCTDNAAMIAMRAYQHYLAKNFSSLDADVQSTMRPKRKANR